MAKRPIRPIRRRVFVGCEGDGDVSFVIWLSRLCEEAERGLAFDSRSLGGGDPLKMLDMSIKYFTKGKRNGEYSCAILLIDSDRIENLIKDGLIKSEDDFRERATEAGLTLILQRPKLEGVLLRLHDGHERRFPSPQDTNNQLRRVWPEVWGGNHRRAVDADTLGRRFALADLRRAAACDEELRRLLELLGLPP